MKKLLLITVKGDFNAIEFRNHMVYKIQHYNMHTLPAQNPEITGNVEQLGDSELRIRAEGEESDLAYVLNVTKVGPLLAHITQVDVDWKPAGNQYKTFSTKRSSL